MTILNNVMSAVQKRVAYSRLKYELQSMPQETAMDLGLFREDAAKIATKAVYG